MRELMGRLVDRREENESAGMVGVKERKKGRKEKRRE